MATARYGNGISASIVPTRSFDPVVTGSGDPEVDGLLGGAQWGKTVGAGVDLTWSFSTTTSSYTYGDDDSAIGFIVNLTSQQKTRIQQVMDAWSAVGDLGFTQVSDSATGAGDIRWAATKDPSVDTAYAYYPGSYPDSGDVWIGYAYPEYLDPIPGDYSFATLVHELGHALGLGHPHESEVSFDTREDHIKYSVMSYRSYEGEPLEAGGYTNDVFPAGPMLNDIAAIQYLYGPNTTHEAGDTVYRWDNNAYIFETIWDAAGNDTIDASNQSQAVTLDLMGGHWSTIGKAFNNGRDNVRDYLAISYDAVIENAIGTTKADILRDNAVANRLEGGAGNDDIYLSGGNDSVLGGDGVDTVYFSSRPVLLDATDGYTVSLPESGDEVWLSDVEYVVIGSADPVRVDTLSSDGGTDPSIIAGTEGADKLKGTDADETLYGYGGKDQLTAGGGQDMLDGGEGNDMLSGEDGDDTLDGGDGKDTLSGGLGDDVYIIDNIKDTVRESKDAGWDTVITSVSYTLPLNVETLQLDGEDEITGKGNTLDNELWGNIADNRLDGAAGNDTLIGGGGNDILIGGKGDDTFVLYADEVAGCSLVISGFGQKKGDLDLIDLSDLGVTWDDLAVSTTSKGVMVYIEATDTQLLLTGVKLSQISEDDFVLL